jgi:hypothetical protein
MGSTLIDFAGDYGTPYSVYEAERDGEGKIKLSKTIFQPHAAQIESQLPSGTFCCTATGDAARVPACSGKRSRPPTWCRAAVWLSSARPGRNCNAASGTSC